MDDKSKQDRRTSLTEAKGRILAVGAILAMAMAVGVALYYHHKYQTQREETQQQMLLAAGFKDQFDKALEQAITLQHQLQAAQETGKSLQAQRDIAMGEIRKSSEQLKKDLTAMESALAEQEKLRNKSKVLEQTVNVSNAALNLATRERDAACQSLDAARKEAREARKESAAARMELAEASIRQGEMKRQQEQSQAAMAKEMKAARKAFSSSLDSLALFYVVQQSGGMRGLAGAQVAAGRVAVLSRLADLRLAARGEKTRELLNRLEAVLTRLELLNPNEAGQKKAFAAFLGADLIPRIDQLLLENEEKAELEGLLLEARLILSGAEHVP